MTGSNKAPPREERSRSLFTFRSRNFPVVNNSAARVKTLDVFGWSPYQRRYLSQNAVGPSSPFRFSFSTFIASVNSTPKQQTDLYDDRPSIPGRLRRHSGRVGFYDGPTRYPT